MATDPDDVRFQGVDRKLLVRGRDGANDLERTSDVFPKAGRAPDIICSAGGARDSLSARAEGVPCESRPA
jgi:hypothetical protein